MSNFYTDVIQKDIRFTTTDSCRDILLLEPVTRQRCRNIILNASLAGFKLIITETYRSSNRQEMLFRKGATKLKNVGVHHYGLAADFVFLRPDGSVNYTCDYSPLWKWADEQNLVSGHDWGLPLLPHTFRDNDHVQRVSLADQTKLFNGSWYPDTTYNPGD